MVLGWVLRALTAVMTMLGRLNLGLRNAGASRYTTVGILLMIATAALISVLLMPSREGSSLRTCIVAGVWLVAGTMFVLDYPSEVKAMKESYVQRVETKKCLQRATSAEEPCLSLALGDKQAAFERSRYLKRLGWAGLAKVD